MKGYKEELREFINYVFKIYGKDSRIGEFKSIFTTHEAKRLAYNKYIKERAKTLRISEKTANLCNKLVNCELIKARVVEGYSKAYILKLKIAKLELKGVLKK